MEQNLLFYHTFKEYDQQGIDPFLEHVQRYLSGAATVPVAKPNVIEGNGNPEITFTYSNEMYQRFLTDLESVRKPHDVAMRFGFRGYSGGKRNGIFYLRSKHDRGLYSETRSLLGIHERQVREDLDLGQEFNLQEDGLDALRAVKIVRHEPSGTRVVGVYKTENKRMIFLGFGKY